jgi:serine/threonine protein kinase
MLLKGRYLIEKELGRGGIGLVYLARDHHLHSRPVVIKVLLEGTEGDADRQWFERKFLQEIEALARIDHPSVIGILDTGEMPNGQPFFVMQFVVGDSLRAAMQPGPMEFNRVAGLIRQMGNALHAAHEQGIIHRDLKPENIMLQQLSNGEDLVKLIDFGIATVKC